MPRIPTYDELQGQARPLPGGRQESIVSPGLVDAGAQQQMQNGRALQAAGSDLTQVAIRMQDQQNADSVFRAETGIKNDYLAFETQARDRRGDAAKGLAQDAASWWDKAYQQHADRLENDAQRRVFQQQVAKLRLQSLDSMSAYEAGQRRESLNESAQASIVGSINLAASQVGTPTEQVAIAGAKDDVLKRLAVQKQINGWSEDLYTAKQAEALTNLHLQVIQNKVDKDPAGAKQYFELNKAEVNGTKYDQIEKVLKLGGLKETAQKTSDQLAAQGMTEADGLTYIRQHLTGEDQEAAATEWKTRWAEQNAAREHSQKTAADTAWGIYARSGRVSDIPAGVMAQMDGRDLVAIKRAATAAAQDKMPKTDWSRYYDLRQQAFDNPSGFASYDLRRDFPALAPAQREQLIDLQTKARNGGIKDVATLESQLSNMHQSLGWGASDLQKKGQFDTAVQREINTEEKAAGKPLNFEQRQKVIDRMAIERSNTWSQFGTTRYYEVAGTEDAAGFAPKIPDTERAKIEAALKRAGRPVSDTAVMQLYKQRYGLQ